MSGPFQGTDGEAIAPRPRLLDIRWALRRALLGIAILAVGVGCMAWLTHASIDPVQEAASNQTSP